ncbi:uncharacterized protein [Oscarella lobularis]|uniref:uncharacterized protein n=1 Tax=Oscarella lobularis TaxID=121494 RepID=UPI003313CC7F
MAFAAELRASGRFSNISVTVEEVTLKLHLFPLLARSKYFQSLVSSEMADSTSVTLHDLPGGLETMDLVADFCYDIDIAPRVGCENVGALVCAASYLQMIGTNNLLDVAHETLERLSKESALNCLEILKGCCTMAIQAESELEGLVELCTSSLADYWNRRSRSSLSISDKEASVLPELPLKWMPGLLTKINQATSTCSSKIVMAVIMAVVTWPPADEEHLLELTDAPKVKTRSSLPRSTCDTDVSTLDDQLNCTTVFDALAEHISSPSYNSLFTTIPSSTRRWFCKALLFSNQHKLKSYSKLLQHCSSLQSHLTVEECKEFSPDLMRNINMSRSNKTCSTEERKKICSLNDEYLLLHCKRGSIRASGFLSIMRSVSEFRCPSSSFDRPFEAFEALLRKGTVSQKEVTEMSNTIDYAKLSNEYLQKAASNDKIPRDVVLSCVVQLCQKQRSELERCSSASRKLQNDIWSLQEENKTLKEENEQMKRAASTKKLRGRGRHW